MGVLTMEENKILCNNCDTLCFSLINKKKCNRYTPLPTAKDKKIYLTFTKIEDKVIIFNNDNINLGRLEKVRVGQWMSWCLFLNPDCYLSASCQDEVREMTKKLNSVKQ